MTIREFFSFKWLVNLFRKKDNPAPAPKPQSAGTLWANYSSPSFFIHGVPNENDIREDAIRNAKQSECILCTADFGMGDELAMHLLALEHPEKPGYYLEQDGWFFKAERAGVYRWIHFMSSPSMEQAKRWVWLTKSEKYQRRLQYFVTATTDAAVLAYLREAATKNQIEVVVK